jgi:endonuclease/exonuclease/phosphatase family metal-dependent hydrolase
MVHFGIDVHKKESQICILAEGIEHRIQSWRCLHVVSWNLHGPPSVGPVWRRIERVARLLLSREPGPDLILLQEVWFERDAKHIEKAFGGTYERIRDSDVVTSHRGWVFGFRKGGLLAFLNGRSRWKVPDTSLFKEYAAHAPKWRFWQGDGLSGKGIQRFDLQQPGYRVVVLNTHLQSPYPKEKDLFGREDLYPEVRGRQIDELAAYTSKEAAGVIVLVVGDFNTAASETDLYAKIKNVWADLTATYREECKCGTIIDKKGPRREWIDYVLSRTPPGTEVRVDQIRLIKNTSVDRPYSDHHGLELQLSLPN